MEVQTVLAIGFPPLIAICRNVQVNRSLMTHKKTNEFNLFQWMAAGQILLCKSHVLSHVAKDRRFSRGPAPTRHLLLEEQSAWVQLFQLVNAKRNSAQVRTHSRKQMLSATFPCFLLFTVHGNWSNFELKEPCSVTCGMGIEVYERKCNNPTPQFNGNICRGESTKEEECQKSQCPSNFPLN